MKIQERIEELKSEAAAISELINRSTKRDPKLMDRIHEIRQEIDRLEEQEDESKFLAYLDRVEVVSGSWY